MLLDQIDQKIIKALEKGGLHPSDISRAINLPRTTIAYRLARLEKQKVVRSRSVGRKMVWEINFRPQNDAVQFKIYSGEEFQNAYLECFNVPAKSVVLSIQSVSAGRSELKFIPRDLVFKVHNFFKKKNIVFKSISNQKMLAVFGEIDKNYVKSHIGRSGGIKLFKNNLFEDGAEIIVCETFAMISNPNIKTAVVIKDPGIIKTMREALTLLFDTLEQVKGFSLNEYLRKIVDTLPGK